MGYITCNQKKNRPMVNVAVCAKCIRRKKCSDYGNYLQPPLFPDLFEVRIRLRELYYRDNKPKKMKSEATEIVDKPEQLALNL